MGILGGYTSAEEKLFEQSIRGDITVDRDKFEELDIDKSWQLIHFLLCKCVENGEPPMGYVVPMRDENELDFGEDIDARIFYINAQQVKEANDYLNSLSDDALKAMYDFKAMRENDVYPNIDDEDETDLFEYIYSHLTAIREFYNQAAENGHSIALTIC